MHETDDTNAVGRETSEATAQTFLLDALVDAQLLVDVQVPLGEVGFRLIVVVVRNEVFTALSGK